MRKSPATIFRIAAVVCVLLILGGLGLWYALDPWHWHLAPGVSVGGVELGGLTVPQAHKTLENALEENLYGRNLAVVLPEQTLILAPEGTGVEADVPAALWDAFRYGRSGKQPLQALELQSYLTLREEDVRLQLEEYAGQYNTELVQHSWRVEGEKPPLGSDVYDESTPCQTLVLTAGVPSVHLDVDRVYGEILDMYNLALTAPDLQIHPENEPDALPDSWDLEEVYRQLCTKPVDDSLDMQTYQPVPGAYGYEFDLVAARRWSVGAQPGETMTLDMVCTAPEILGDGVYFRDVLGACDTKHTADENRNNNLRLLCQALDGLILEPGQEFSYNESVGERTAEKGYLPATAYSGTRIVKDIGGGVCQGSTTLYNCALLADLEILERVCHGATVGYVTLGLDAAVNWNTKTDLKFKNNFNFPMMIKAEVSDGYVRMKILGTDEKDYTIEMRCGRSEDGDVTYAVSYKCKYSKETGEQISKELEARSTYYKLSD